MQVQRIDGVNVGEYVGDLSGRSGHMSAVVMLVMLWQSNLFLLSEMMSNWLIS